MSPFVVNKNRNKYVPFHISSQDTLHFPSKYQKVSLTMFKQQIIT